MFREHTLGDGVLQDYAEAARWYRLAVDEVRLTVTKGRGAPDRIGTSMDVYRVEPDKRGFSWPCRAGY